ncbi:MAG: hypothetical protein ABIH22_01315 [Candidatus Margulisiibacteriota bacterium]
MKINKLGVFQLGVLFCLFGLCVPSNAYNNKTHHLDDLATVSLDEKFVIISSPLNNNAADKPFLERIKLDKKIEEGKLDYMFAIDAYVDREEHIFAPVRLVITIYDTGIVTTESKDAYFKRISEFPELGGSPRIVPKEIYRSLKVKKRNGDVLLETGEIVTEGDSFWHPYKREKYFLALLTDPGKKFRVFIYIPARKTSEYWAGMLAKETAESLLLSAEARKQCFEHLAYFIKYGKQKD